MKTLWIPQRSDEWMEARRGIPTASEFDALVTPKGELRKGEGRQTYILRKLAENLVGYTATDGGGATAFMQQGEFKERYALPWFEMHVDRLVEVPGICLTDDGKAGCSPDGLIKGEECGVELKCPDSHTHLEFLLSRAVPKDYIAQVQGCMYVTGFQWWWYASWHHKLPPLAIKVARDDIYQNAIREGLKGFWEDFNRGLERVQAIIGPQAKAPAPTAKAVA